MLPIATDAGQLHILGLSLAAAVARIKHLSRDPPRSYCPDLVPRRYDLAHARLRCMAYTPLGINPQLVASDEGPERPSRLSFISENVISYDDYHPNPPQVGVQVSTRKTLSKMSIQLFHAGLKVRHELFTVEPVFYPHFI